MLDTAIDSPRADERRKTRYVDLLHRLSRQSVAKHFDAYEDVPWNDPDFRIEQDDPRWERDASDPLGATEWYQALDQSTRARLGLHLIVAQMKLGVDFENVLSRGMLEFASTLPNRTPEFRYAYHEIIEEGQHSLMFQEFVNRSGLDPRGLHGFEAAASRTVVRFGRTFPELFLLFVLGGEAPIDRVQRAELRRRDALHPLLRTVMRIHVTEEARHLCFAKSYLREHVPALSPLRRFQLKVRAPIIFGAMARQMLEPPSWLAKEYGVPKSVLREAFYDNSIHRQKMLDGLEPVRELCVELGIATPAFSRLWDALGIWPKTEGCLDPATRSP